MQLYPGRKASQRLRLSCLPSWRANDGEPSLSFLSNSPGNRRRAILLPIGLLMLSMAVFGWGLQYKLSLYQGKDSISHLAPVAKLLSQKERPAVGQALARPAAAPAWPFLAWSACLIATLAFALCQAAARYLRSGSLEGGRHPLPPCLEAILRRPPPAASFPLQDFERLHLVPVCF